MSCEVKSVRQYIELKFSKARLGIFENVNSYLRFLIVKQICLRIKSVVYEIPANRCRFEVSFFDY